MRRIAFVAILLVAAPLPSAGQDPHPAVIRSTTGISLLYPVQSGHFTQGVTSFRATQSLGLTPRFGLELSGLQTGGADAVLQAGGIGARLTHAVGPLLVRPGAEAVIGRVIVDHGGWYVEQPGGGLVYQPFRRPTDQPAVGGGMLANAEWYHRSGFGLDLMVGYWHVFTPVTASTLVVGAGPRRGRRDPVWYWRTSGRDETPPRLVVFGPETDADGVYRLGTAGLGFLAADRSGVVAIEVDGVPLVTRSVPRGEVEVTGATGPAVTATLLPVIAGGPHAVRVEAQDGAGNRGSRIVRVMGPAPGGTPAVVTTPVRGVPVNEPYADVAGFVASPMAGVRVEVNGCVAHGAPVDVQGSPGHAFNLRVPLRAGLNQLEVTTHDPLGGRSVLRQDVVHDPLPVVPTDPPGLVPLARTSVSGRSYRVHGQAWDPGPSGILEVRVGGRPAAMTFADGRRTDVSFLAFVDVAGDSVGGHAVALDGREAPWTVVPDAGRSEPRAAALFIAIEEYAEPGLQGPAGAAAVAGELGELLRSRGAIPLDAQHLRILRNGDATARGIRDATRWLSTTARHVDVVVVYVAGRGVRDASGEAVGLVPYDVRASYGPGSIPWPELDELFRSLPAEVVVLVDLADGTGRAVAPPRDPACRAGTLPLVGLAVLSATGPSDGSFSRRLVNALEAPSRAGDDVVRLGDLESALGAGDDPALRSRGPTFDPHLPLTRRPHAR